MKRPLLVTKSDLLPESGDSRALNGWGYKTSRRLCLRSQLPSPSHSFFLYDQVARLIRGMRLLRTLPALALLLGARASDYDTRDLLDVCAFVDADLAVPNLLGVVSAFGRLGGLIPFMPGVHCC